MSDKSYSEDIDNRIDEFDLQESDNELESNPSNKIYIQVKNLLLMKIMMDKYKSYKILHTQYKMILK